MSGARRCWLDINLALYFPGVDSMVPSDMPLPPACLTLSQHGAASLACPPTALDEIATMAAQRCAWSVRQAVSAPFLEFPHNEMLSHAWQ